MKKHAAILLFTLLTISLFSQSPDLMTYQMVVRDNAGNIVAGSSVGLRLSILQGSAAGAVVFAETHNAPTNGNGLLSVLIGNGTNVSGSIAAINWAAGPYFLRAQTDPAGGTNYTIENISQLVSVPYSYYSAEAQSAQSAGNGFSHVSETGDTLYFLNGSYVIIPGISGANGGISDIPGCTSNTACNYNSTATQDDGSCYFIGSSCNDGDSSTVNDAYNGSCACAGVMLIPGCTSNTACNYNSTATQDDGSCYFIGSPCNDGDSASINDAYNGSCACTGELLIQGCTSSTACNYNSTATQDDGSCYFIGSPCNDNNSSTFSDVYNASCICEGSTVTIGAAHSCGAQNVHNSNLTYGSMTDQEGNSYKTIVIGTQEWMAENLNTSIYRNGDAIPTGLSDSQWQNTTQGAWAYYNNDASYACPYGKLYNWYACVDARGLCPTGWHVPSDAEWTDLTTFLGGESVAGGAMKSAGTIDGGDIYWYPYDPSVEGTNSSGFSGLPGGYRISLGSYNDMGVLGYWWSSSQYESSLAWYWGLNYYTTTVSRNANGTQFGWGVRCLRDDGVTGQVPGCTSSTACNYNSTATQDDGSCYFIGSSCNDGNSSTFNDVYNASCVCEGSTGTMGAAHSCGAQNVHNPNLTYGSMTDQEGNSYKTIVIGTQEWMAENLNTSIYSNGDAIPTGLSNSEWANTNNTQQGAWAYYNNDASNACPYGKMYNWYACVDPRGLCPTGWHVPSDEEWTDLTTFLGGESVAGGAMKSTGTIEAATGLWYSPNEGATNSSGFSGLPGGSRYLFGDYYDLGNYGFWWSSSQYDSVYAWNRILGYTNAGVYPLNNANTRNGWGVRCLRD